MKSLRYGWLFALACMTPAVAQDIPEQPAGEELRATEEKARTMAQIYLSEQVANKRMPDLLPGSAAEGYYGFAVVPADRDGVWRVMHLIRRGQGLAVLAQIDVADGQVLSEAVYPADARPAASVMASKIAIAQILALRAVYPRMSDQVCDRSRSGQPGKTYSPIFLTLPPAEGDRVVVYLLNGPIDRQTIPLGKHMRVLVDVQAQTAEASPISTTCRVINTDEAPDVGHLVGRLTERSDALIPTEVTLLLSRLLPPGASLDVKAGGMTWQVTDGHISTPHSANTEDH